MVLVLLGEVEDPLYLTMCLTYSTSFSAKWHLAKFRVKLARLSLSKTLLHSFRLFFDYFAKN
jgi:hypothetical protein